MNIPDKKTQRIKRHRKIRAKVHGTKDVPRFCVFRSNQHIYAQIIDDEKGMTLVSASDLQEGGKKKNVKADLARQVGELIAKKAQEKKITKVVFDRGGFKYHGRIKTLAEEARKNGLKF